MADEGPEGLSTEQEVEENAQTDESRERSESVVEKIALEPEEDEDDDQDDNHDGESASAADTAENGSTIEIGESRPEAENGESGQSVAATSPRPPQPLKPVRAELSTMRPTLRGTFEPSSGTWVGEWAMSDQEFEMGVRGSFEYQKTAAIPDEDVAKPPVVEGQPEDMYMSGSFLLQNPANPQQMIPKKENDILVRFAATDGEIAVQGFGKNEFGTFSLSGTYSPDTQLLALYRAYQPRAVDSSKKSKSKKKGAPSTPSANPTPKRPSRAAAPIIQQGWDAASAAGPAAAVSQRARRPPAHVMELGEEESKVKARMLPILESLLSQDRMKLFHFPVDPVRDGIPQYAEIIKDPMDLGTVKKRLMAGAYQNEEHMAADVQLTFSNAMIFNPVGHPVYELAKALHTKFENDVAKVISRREAEKERKRKSLATAAVAPAKNGKRSKLSRQSSARSDESHYSDDESFDSGSHSKPSKSSSRRGAGAAEPVPAAQDNEELRLLRQQVEMMSRKLESFTQTALPHHVQPSYAATQMADPPYTATAPKRPRAAPKPTKAPVQQVSHAEYEDDFAQARAPKQERPLSYQEKRTLSQDINKLPAEKVQRVLDIIAESGSQMIGDGAEEVEIDIEKLDTTTLKALQKYVRDVLKNEKKKAANQGFM